MPESVLEQVMHDFIEHKLDLLVSTNIIESGIDIPSANTLFVNHSDRFGLADLYQLRGRIGRFKETAHAYFFIPRGYLPTEEGKARLGAIRRFTALGSGFRIAMRDLEIRGAGNILGVEQHGTIQAIGFDLYLRLLRETIERLKFVIILSFVLLNLSFASYAETIGKIVAIVNDEVITQQELEEALRELPPGENQEGSSRRQVALERLIENSLILQKGKEAGMTVMPEELEEVIRRIKNRYTSKEAFEDALLDVGLSYKEFEHRHRDQLIVRKMMTKEVRAKSNVSPRETEDYYKNNLSDFQGPEAWKLSHILVRKRVPSKEDPEARRRARHLLKRLRKGEDFAFLATNYSEGPRSEEGGELGFVERRKLMKEIEQALSSLPVGGISNIVETPIGYNIFRVEERKQSVIQALQEVKGKIHDKLQKEKIKKRYEEWMGALKKDAYIKQ